ncbi:MAG: carbon-nitrogen hydrolase family protein [Marinobacterium sp.]|nr:carbon-nitrogen hydrolase family protein [Marinobacterium sp.]
MAISSRRAGRVAVIQMVSGTDVQSNLAVAQRLLTIAAEGGARLVLLPENFALLDSAALRPLAEREQQDGQIMAFLSEQARIHGIWLVAGSVPLVDTPQGGEVAAPRVRSACLVFDDQGQLQARYDKVHLFDVEVADAHASYRESSLCEPGDQLVVVDTPLGRLGLSICYDLRFPEQFQRLRALGAELISVPSAFTFVTGQMHWEVLLRARAIETQCYLLGADQGGTHSATRETWGQSMIVSPDGAVLNQLARGEGVVFAEVDRLAQQSLRTRMPVAEHRHQAGF